MSDSLYPRTTAQVVPRREELAPDIHTAWNWFSKAVFAAGAVDEQTEVRAGRAYAHSTIALNAMSDQPHARHDHSRGHVEETS